MAEATQKKKSNVGGTILSVVLILVIIALIFFSYVAYTTKAGSGIPSVLGVEVFSVQSNSMYPTFQKGDLIIDNAIKDYNDLKVGDIITFWTVINGIRTLNTHRIVGIENMGDYLLFDTMGDAATEADETKIHQRDVVGIYKTHIKGVGTAIDYLQTSKGFFICIVVPVAIFFLYQLIVFLKTLTAYRTEKIRMQLQEELAAANAAKPDAAPVAEPKAQEPAAEVKAAEAAPAEAEKKE